MSKKKAVSKSKKDDKNAPKLSKLEPVNAKELLKQGYVHCLITFELIGKPAKHVDDTLVSYLENIKKEEGIKFLDVHIEPAIESDQMFSAYAEVDMLVKNMEIMTWLAINYTPASIEIIEPLDFEFSALDMQNWLNDLLSRLHTIGANYKSAVAELDYVKDKMVTLIDNTILLSLGRGPKQLSELEKDTALVKETAEIRLKKLIESNKVIEKKGVYSLA
jgi:hypothetical protein